jgi:hypothetical protein
MSHRRSETEKLKGKLGRTAEDPIYRDLLKICKTKAHPVRKDGASELNDKRKKHGRRSAKQTKRATKLGRHGKKHSPREREKKKKEKKKKENTRYGKQKRLGTNSSPSMLGS